MKSNKMIFKILALTLVFGFLAAGFAMAAQETVTGTLHKDNQGNFSIATPDGQTNLVQGTANLSNMEGKIVKATGTVEQKVDMGTKAKMGDKPYSPQPNGQVKAIKIMTMQEVK